MTCPHGESSSHGEPEKDWCAGPLSRSLEAWRSQLEAQMNMPPMFLPKPSERCPDCGRPMRLDLDPNTPLGDLLICNDCQRALSRL